MPCPLCYPDRNVVACGEFWTVVLNDDQGQLGRCYFALKRHVTDLTALSPEEREELWALFTEVKGALDRLWKPDHYNYVFLMNVQPHLHGHIIPRYETARVFDHFTFVDGVIGKHYDLENRFTPPEDTLVDIAHCISSEIALKVSQ